MSTNNADDETYLKFLQKANENVKVGLNADVQTTTSGAGKGTKTVDAGIIVPPTLASVREYYVSDADEPFLPVVLGWDGVSNGNWPDRG